MRLKIGDEVQIIAGKDKGLRGTIQRILRKKSKVVVSGVNFVKKHQKQQQTSSGSVVQGGIIELEAPIHVSNVMLVCPVTQQPTRIGIRQEGEYRVRYSKKSEKTIENKH